MYYKPFDIVTANYRSLNGEEKTGLFCVLHICSTNLTVAKLTSQFDPRFLDFSVALYQKSNPFLQADSYVQLDKIHTISTHECEYLGSVAPCARTQIKSVWNRFCYRILDGFNRNIRSYVSPNAKDRF